jgi:hypothetical protein
LFLSTITLLPHIKHFDDDSAEAATLLRVSHAKPKWIISNARPHNELHLMIASQAVPNNKWFLLRKIQGKAIIF